MCFSSCLRRSLKDVPAGLPSPPPLPLQLCAPPNSPTVLREGEVAVETIWRVCMTEPREDSGGWGQRSQDKPSCILNLPPQVWVACPLPHALLAHLVQGPVSDFSREASVLGKQQQSRSFELLFAGCLEALAYVVCLLRIKRTETSNSTRVEVESLFTPNPGRVFYCTRHYSLSF